MKKIFSTFIIVFAAVLTICGTMTTLTSCSSDDKDEWGKSSRDGKDDAVVRMLEAAAGRDMTAEKPAWVINYPSAYFGLPLSDSYRENAVEANKVAANWLSSHTGSVGIIYMDFAGMEKSPSYSCEKLYETLGMTLVDRVIKQNAK